MDFNKLTKEELITELEHKTALLNQFLNEKEEETLLKFSWTGNLGHWYWDVRKNIVQFNPLKIKAIGYDPSEFSEPIGFQFFTEKLHPDDYEQVMQNMRDHLSGLSSVYEVEYRIKAKDGSWKYYHDRGKITQYDANGKPLLLAGIVFDITKKKEAEQTLMESEKKLRELVATKDRFFSILAQDLKSPFNILLGFSDVLHVSSQKGDYQKTELYAGLIHETAQQTYSLLENLLEWSNSQRGKTQFEPAIIDLKPLIDDTTKLLQNIAETKNITLENKISSNIVAFADGNMLTTVVRNLVSNAIKFTNPGGIIKIEALFDDTKTDILITDNGIGMEKEVLDKLFKIEHSVSTPGTNDETGTGLGLILCKELIDKHNGSIQVESSLGKGSCFTISLPMAK
jgi:PAS domain S-box-containing protein